MERKIIAIALTIVMSSTLISCNRAEDTDKKTDKETVTTTAATQSEDDSSSEPETTVVTVTSEDGSAVTEKSGKPVTEVVTVKAVSGSAASDSKADASGNKQTSTTRKSDETTKKSSATTKKSTTTTTTKKSTTTTKKTVTTKPTTVTTTKPTTTTTTASAYIPTYEDALWIKEQAIAYGKSIGLTHDETVDRTCDWVSYSGAILEYGADKNAELQRLKEHIRKRANSSFTEFNVVIYLAGDWTGDPEAGYYNGYPVYCIDGCYI